VEIRTLPLKPDLLYELLRAAGGAANAAEATGQSHGA
jgi:hypothetical protein